MAGARRNTKVNAAVELALSRVDYFLSGGELSSSDLLEPGLRRVVEDLLAKSASVRTCGLFLAFYKLVDLEASAFTLVDSAYDFTRPPIGLRGQHGDKLLSEELSKRDITLHSNVVAFGENLGIKGAASNFDFTTDPRFAEYASALTTVSTSDLRKVCDYLASRFAQSQKIMPALPPVGDDVLTFVRAKRLFWELVELQTEGYVQQFLVAALLEQARMGSGIEVTTHHPHASDRYDRTAGDIEERLNGNLYRAYEVTVRPDWKSRVSGFKAKMDEYELRKYVIIAGGVNEDEAWAEPANLALKLDEYGRDIAVVDILDVLHWMAAELSAQQLQRAVNKVQEMLINPKLCGRHDIAGRYKEAVEQWLDEVSKDAS